jgi:site-specific recombinase XerD
MDVHLEAKTIFVAAGKGAKDRICLIAKTTIEALRVYWAIRTEYAREDGSAPSPFAFSSLRGRSICKSSVSQLVSSDAAHASA